MQEMLQKQAEGFAELVKAAGGERGLRACSLLLADKMEELMKIQVEAVKNLNIDKITVWDSMNGEGGTPTTAEFPVRYDEIHPASSARPSKWLD